VPSEISPELVKHIAHLSRLNATETELEAMAAELSKVVGYIDLLAEVDTTDVEPTAHALPLRNVFREDEVRDSFDPDTALANAPEREKTFFRVPKVLDNEGGA
jgi:aspartyl-tRNA(Asn)/glutamyl-tRNA(Gln) amidotransferase subunit C